MLGKLLVLFVSLVVLIGYGNAQEVIIGHEERPAEVVAHPQPMGETQVGKTVAPQPVKEQPLE